VQFSQRASVQVHFEISNPSSGAVVYAVSTNQPRRLFAKPKRGILAARASVHVAVTLDGDCVPTLLNEFKASQLVQGEPYQAGALLVRSAAQGSPSTAASSPSSSELASDAAAMISRAVAAPSAVLATLPVLVSFPGLEATSAGAAATSAVALPVSEAELLDRHIDAVRRSHQTIIKARAVNVKRVNTGSSNSSSTTAGEREDLLKHLAAEASALKKAYHEQLKASLKLTAERDRLAWQANETADALLTLTDPNHAPGPKKKKKESSSSPSTREDGSLEPSTAAGAKAMNGGGASEDNDGGEMDSGFSPAQVLTILLLSFLTGRLFPLR